MVNQLYRQIELNPKSRDRVKLIGIGVGNSDFEVGYFRQVYNIPFPLFADGSFAIHKQLGQVRTPFFIGIKIDPDGNRETIYAKRGGFGNAEQFLTKLLHLSGL